MIATVVALRSGLGCEGALRSFFAEFFVKSSVDEHIKSAEDGGCGLASRSKSPSQITDLSWFVSLTRILLVVQSGGCEQRRFILIEFGKGNEQICELSWFEMCNLELRYMGNQLEEPRCFDSRFGECRRNNCDISHTQVMDEDSSPVGDALKEKCTILLRQGGEEGCILAKGPRSVGQVMRIKVANFLFHDHISDGVEEKRCVVLDGCEGPKDVGERVARISVNFERYDSGDGVEEFRSPRARFCVSPRHSGNILRGEGVDTIDGDSGEPVEEVRASSASHARICPRQIRNL